MVISSDEKQLHAHKHINYQQAARNTVNEHVFVNFKMCKIVGLDK